MVMMKKRRLLQLILVPLALVHGTQTARSQTTDCLVAGWPSSLNRQGTCQQGHGSRSKEIFSGVPKCRPLAEVPCNPALFGPGLCLSHAREANDGDDTNIRCLTLAREKYKDELAAVTTFLRQHADARAYFRQILESSTINCEKGPRSYCKVLLDWMEEVDDYMTIRDFPRGELICAPKNPPLGVEMPAAGELLKSLMEPPAGTVELHSTPFPEEY